MAKGDYYFKLFYKRLLSSTIGWKDDEFGAYVRLLIHQFDNDNRIPDDLDHLSRIAPSIKKNWKLIGKKFKKDESGLLYNEVMSDEWNDVQEKKERNKSNGSNGGRPIAVKAGEMRFYVIECFKENERFYKVGATESTIKKRYSSSTGNGANMPYSFNIVVDKIFSHEFSLRLEEAVLNNFPKHVPSLKFPGHKECIQITPGLFDYINRLETQIKPDGLFVGSQKKPELITNNQEPITNTVINTSNSKTVVGHNPETTTTDFVNERQEKIYEMFKRVTTWKAEIIMLEVSRFMNKYPTVPLNQCGALINTWAANYKPVPERTELNNSPSNWI